MTEFLLRIFVKNYEYADDTAVRNRIGAFASCTGIILNLILASGKFIAGIISGSVSVIADGLNNFMDSAGSVITLIGFKFSVKKADKEHPFGHGRFEYLSGLAVSVLIFLVGIELVKNSIKRIIEPETIEYGWLMLAVLIISVLIKLWMAHFSKKIGQKIKSQSLIAVSADSRNDAIATSAVFITAIVNYLGNLNLDGWMGLGIAVFIIYNGIILIKQTCSPLLGESPSDELVSGITQKIKSYNCVLGIHDLIVHDYGPGKCYASVHVEFSSKIDPLVSHEVIDRIEKYFLIEERIHLVIHYDPVNDGFDK